MQKERIFYLDFIRAIAVIEVLSMSMISVIVTGILAKLLHETTNYIITSAENMCEKE